MARIAAIKTADSTFLWPEKFREMAAQPLDIPHKGVKFLPVPPVAPPAYDPATETVVGPTYIVNALEVTETWTKRALTAPELAAVKDLKMSAIDIATFLALLNHENRMRLLENQVFATSKVPLTQVTGLAAFRTLIP